MTNFVSWINDVPGQSGALFAAAAAWKQVGQQIASAADDIYAVDDALSSWVGFARASFHRSSQRSYHRYLRACLIVCVSVFCLKGLMHDE